MVALDFPPEFTNVFPRFVHSLLENQLTEKKAIYEFAVKYFEDLIQVRNLTSGIRTSRSAKEFQRDIPTVFDNAPVLASFSFDSQLESNSFEESLGVKSRRRSSQKKAPEGIKKPKYLGRTQGRRSSPCNVLGYMMVEFSEVLTKYITIFSEISQDKKDSLHGSDLDSQGSDDNAKSPRKSSTASPNSVYLRNVIASSKRLQQLINFGIGDSFEEDEWEEGWQDFENYMPREETRRGSVDLSDDECFQEFQRVAEEVNWVPDDSDPWVITGPSFFELENALSQSKHSEMTDVGLNQRNRPSVVMFADSPSTNLLEDSFNITCRSAGSREMEEEREWFYSSSSPPSSSESDEVSEPLSSIDSFVGVDFPAQATQLCAHDIPKTPEDKCICDGDSVKPLPMDGFDFFRAYFTLRKIRQVEESGDVDDDFFVKCSDLGSPVLVRCEAERVSFGIADAIRSWFFVRRIKQLEHSQDRELEEELETLREQGFEIDRHFDDFSGQGTPLNDARNYGRSELLDHSSEQEYQLNELFENSRKEKQETGWNW